MPDALYVSQVYGLSSTQWRNEVRWRSGQEASLAPPCSKLRSFGSKYTVLKKVILILWGLFGDRGMCPPFPPRYASASTATDFAAAIFYITMPCGRLDWIINTVFSQDNNTFLNIALSWDKQNSAEFFKSFCVNIGCI